MKIELKTLIDYLKSNNRKVNEVTIVGQFTCNLKNCNVYSVDDGFKDCLSFYEQEELRANVYLEKIKDVYCFENFNDFLVLILK